MKLKLTFPDTYTAVVDKAKQIEAIVLLLNSETPEPASQVDSQEYYHDRVFLLKKLWRLMAELDEMTSNARARANDEIVIFKD